MPSYLEVRFYLDGLWLLLKGDAQGFRLLDVSERGMTRSFWAFLWCLPAMFVSWNWIRLSFLEASPPGTKAGLPFFLRLALIEAINWIVPLIFIAVVCMLMNIARKFPAIVVTANWLSVPLSYAYAILTLVALALPGLAGVVAIFQMLLLFATVASVSRILRLICGPQPLMVTTLVLVLFVPGLLLSDLLQEFLGVAPY
jgi:hypothetical protein